MKATEPPLTLPFCRVHEHGCACVFDKHVLKHDLLASLVELI